MRIVKRLDLFLLTTFLPLFVMTFGICLFIFLMQFLWLYVDEMVGKGIDISVLAQLFFYAAVTFVPRALPLAILFASLMTFGNLGEQLELLAMKASGISLMRIMRPLTVFLVVVSISAFFFQNNFIPIAQVKMYTILYSVKMKSPELEIPERIFYSGLNGKNLYVRKKDNKRKLLQDIMIYDYSEGFNNARVIVADSGRIKTSTDKKYLILTLYSGESFENFKGNRNRTAEAKDAVPYRRESFDSMEMLIEFDANFDMKDESLYQDRHVAKNMASLQRSIDSMTVRLDSIKSTESKILYLQSYKKTLGNEDVETANQRRLSTDDNPASSNNAAKDAKQTVKPPDFDSLYRVQNVNAKNALLAYAKRNIETLQANYGFKSNSLLYEEKNIRLHHTEMHRKFTLSFACLIFFFIGAPLGAIIRKGGLGAPAVISVILFIVYYIIDNMGYKMARDGIWTPWTGMWMSSIVLLPLGIFLTYKAVNDSVILNAETYIDTLKRLIGKRELRKIEKKEVIMERPDYEAIGMQLMQLKTICKQYLTDSRVIHYFGFWKRGGIDSVADSIMIELEAIVETLKNSDRNIVLNKAMDFPVIDNYNPLNNRMSPTLRKTIAIFFPIGFCVYMIALYRRKLLRRDIETIIKVCDEMKKLI